MQIGELFDGKYEILEFLGSGGVGSVYKAKQVDTLRVVALKILHPAAALDEEYKARFLQEGKALSQIEHENIVKVFHLSVSADARLYLVMEFVSGKTLRQHLNQVERLLPEQAIALVLELSDALACVHEQKIVHRDLKPENLILEETQSGFRLKIVDFGLARLLPEAQLAQKLTQTGELIGTCAYMSPEQCMGKPVDCRSDIYALGLCFYEFLEGKKAFEADTSVGLMYKQINEKAPELTCIKSKALKQGLNLVLKKCLDKDPECRYQSVKVLSRDLSAVQTADLNKTQYPSRGMLILVSMLLLVLISISILLYASCGTRKSSGAKASSNKSRTDTLGAGFEKLSPRMRLAFLKNEIARGNRTQAAGLAFSLLEAPNSMGLNEKIELLGVYVLTCDSIASSFAYAAILDLDRKYPDRVPGSLVKRALYHMAKAAHEIGLNKTTLSYIRKLEEKRFGSEHSSLPSGSSKYFDSSMLSLSRLLEADVYLKEKKTHLAKKIVLKLLSEAPSPFVIVECAEISLKLGLKKELEEKLNAFGSVQELCRVSSKYLSLGDTNGAARMIKIAEQTAGQGRSVDSPDYYEFPLALARARLALASDKSEEAVGILRHFAENDLERVALTRRKGTIEILTAALMIAGDDKLAFKLKGPVTDCSYKQGWNLRRLEADLRDYKADAVKEARRLLCCPELADLDRIVLTNSFIGYKAPDFAFFIAAAANAVQRHPDLCLNSGLACLETYGEFLHAEKLIGKELQILRLIEHINKQYNRNADRVAMGFACKARCRRIEEKCTIGRAPKARQQYDEMIKLGAPPSLRASCLLSLGDKAGAEKTIEECTDASDLIMFSQMALLKGESELAALALARVNLLLPESFSKKNIEYIRLCFARAQVCLERNDRQAAVKYLRDPALCDFSWQCSLETITVLHNLIILTALAELPDDTLRYQKLFRSRFGDL